MSLVAPPSLGKSQSTALLWGVEDVLAVILSTPSLLASGGDRPS
jgi:hypothetical protein